MGNIAGRCIVGTLVFAVLAWTGPVLFNLEAKVEANERKLDEVRVIRGPETTVTRIDRIAKIDATSEGRYTLYQVSSPNTYTRNEGFSPHVIIADVPAKELMWAKITEITRTESYWSRWMSSQPELSEREVRSCVIELHVHQFDHIVDSR